MSFFKFEIAKKYTGPNCKPHAHSHYEIYYLLDGNRHYLIGDSIYNITSGTFIFIKPNIIHKTQGGLFSRFLMYFDSEFAENLPSDLLETCTQRECVPIPKKYQTSFLDILSMFGNLDSFNEKDQLLFARSVMTILLLKINTLLPKIEQEIGPFPEKLCPEPILKTITFLKANYMRNITLQELATNVFVSPAYLCRIFKKYVNVSIFEYLNAIRLDKSIEMMKTTSQTISEIALATGFSSVNYFSKQFKCHFNIMPSSYKKSLKKI